MRIAIALALIASACEDTRRVERRDRDHQADDEHDEEGERLRAFSKSVAAQKRLAQMLADAQPASTGAYECDELIRLVRCMYVKTGTAISDDARKAFEDGVQAWQDALGNPATRQATLDACRMSLDAGREGFAAVGCH